MTTLNLKYEDYEKLCLVSRKADVTKAAIVKWLLARISNKAPFLERYGEYTSYQSDHPSWKKYHICFSPQERERNYDLKKLFKFSLSFMVAFALHYYEQLLLECAEEVDAYIDNYQPKNYLYCSNSSDNERFFTFLWEFGKQKQKE